MLIVGDVDEYTRTSVYQEDWEEREGDWGEKVYEEELIPKAWASMSLIVPSLLLEQCQL